MILIIGGAYQGKLGYALERFNKDVSGVYECAGNNIEAPSGGIINSLEKWILALVKADMEVSAAVSSFIAENNGAVVICTDISCGIVPTDPVLRKWREAVGRALALLSGEAVEVVRLFCGIPTRLK